MTAALIFFMTALLCPPLAEEPHLPNPFARLSSRWNSQSRARRELLAYAIALACGLFLMPLLVWVVGHFVLGPYAHGNAWHFLGDFFAALGRGFIVFWLVALGPTFFLLLLRLFGYALRATR